MNNSKLSNKERFESMANKLVIKELSHGEILAVIKEYFEDYKYKDLATITLGGMRFCFNSDKPMVTAGIYYKNILKVSEIAKLRFSDSIVNTFRNMIMEKGNTNIKIKTPEDYREMQLEFIENFNQNPPRTTKVFDSILNDKKSINKMVSYPEYYLRVKRIFTPVDSNGVKMLKSILLANLEAQLNELKLKRSKQGNKDKIDLDIHFTEKKIKLINKDDEWTR